MHRMAEEATLDVGLECVIGGAVVSCAHATEIFNGGVIG